MPLLLHESEDTPFLRFLSSLSPVTLLSIPFLVLGSIIIFLLYALPMEGIVRWLFFAGLFGAVLFSRMIQFWESGIEVYNFITFCFALIYGPLAALLFTFSVTVPVLFFSVFYGGHMFNHSVPGPLTQTIDLTLISLIAGLEGILARTFVISHLVIFGMATIAICDYLITGFLRTRLTPLTIDRILVYAILGSVINYNLFASFGPQFVGMLASMAG